MLPVDTTMAVMCHVLFFVCCMHVHGSGYRSDYCIFSRSVDCGNMPAYCVNFGFKIGDDGLRTRSPSYSTQSLSRSLSLACPFAHSFAGSLTQSLDHSAHHSLTHSLIRPQYSSACQSLSVLCNHLQPIKSLFSIAQFRSSGIVFVQCVWCY